MVHSSYQITWRSLGSKILAYNENENKYPPFTDIQVLLMDLSSSKKKMKTVTDIQVLFMDLSSSKKKMKTAMWGVAMSQSKRL